MEGVKNPLYRGQIESRVYLLDNEYFYLPHYKYEGIYELYLVDRDGTDHCIQNFCLESSAETLAREDRFWRQNGYKLTNSMISTREIQRLKEREEYQLMLQEEAESELGIPEEEVEHPLQKQKRLDKEEQEKKEARKRRREARKAKEKKNK